MEQVNDAVRLLGRIEERTEGISDDVREIKLMLQIQNGRIRELERKSDKVDGGWKVAGIVGTIAGSLAGLGVKLFG